MKRLQGPYRKYRDIAEYYAFMLDQLGVTPACAEGICAAAAAH